MSSFLHPPAAACESPILSGCEVAVDVLKAKLAFYIQAASDQTDGEILAAYPHEDLLVGVKVPLRALLSSAEFSDHNAGKLVRIDQFSSLNDLRKHLQQAGVISSSLLMFMSILESHVGIFCVVNGDQESGFSEDSLKIYQLISRQFSLEIERRAIIQDSQDKAHQLMVLGESLTAIASRKTPDELLAQLTGNAAHLLRAKCAGLYQYKAERRCLTLIADTTERYKGVTLREGEGMAGILVKTASPYMILPHYQHWEHRAMAFETDEAYGSVIGVPLLWQGRCVGVLYAADREYREFAETDAAQLRWLADQAALAIEQHMEQRRSSFLLASIRVLAEARFDDGLQKLANMLRDLLQNCCCRILLKERGDFLVVKAASAMEQINWVPHVGKQIQSSEWPGLPEILDSHSTIIAYRNEHHGEKLAQFSKMLNLTDLQSVFQAPLRFGEELLGLVEVCQIAGSDHWIFEEEPEKLLAVTASQISVMIAKQFAYDQARRGEARFQSLYNATRLLISEKDPNTALQEMIEAFPQHTGADGVVAIMVDADGKPEESYFGGRKIDLKGTTMRSNGVSSQVLETGESATFDETLNHRDRLNPILFENNCQAAACLPVVLHGKSIGVLWLCYSDTHEFIEEEKATFGLLTGHIAVSYENIRRLRRRDRVQEAIGLISRQSSPAEVHKQIVDGAARTFKADFVTLWPFGQEGNAYLLTEVETASLRQDFKDLIRSLPPSRGHTTDKVRQEHWLTCRDLASSSLPYMKEETRKKLLGLEIRSFQAAVLQSGQEELGVLFLAYKRPRDFSDDDSAAVRAYASYSALFLKQARLSHDLQELAAGAQEIAHHTTQGDLNATLNAVAESTRRLLKCHSVVLYTYDPETGAIGYPPTSKGIDNPSDDWPHPKLPKTSLVRQMIRLDALYVAPLISSDKLFHKAKFPKRHGIVSCAVAPLIVAGVRVGVIFVNHSHSHQFGDEERIRMQFFADQAAIAIQHAQLREKRQRELMEKTALAEVAGELLKTAGMDETLYCAAQLAAQALHTSHASIVLNEKVGRSERILLLAGAKGWDVSWIRTRTVGMGRRSHAGWTIETGKAVLFSPDRDPGFDLSLEHELGLVAGLGVPIKSNHVNIGALLVQDTRQRVFEPNDIQMLELIAEQTAIAIKTARDYQQLEKNTAHSRALEQSAKCLAEVGASPALEEIIFKKFLEEAAKSVTRHQRRDVVVGTIQLYDRKRDLAEVKTVHAIPSDALPNPYKNATRQLRRTADKGEKVGVTGRVILSGERKIIHDVRDDADFIACCPYTLSEIAVPIVEGKQVLGAMNLESDLLNAFDQSDLDNLDAMAKLAVVIIQRTRDYNALQEAKSQLDKTLRVQVQSYEDLVHQLRGPIRQARKHLRGLLPPPEVRRSPTLEAVNGLVGKAFAVVNGINVFTALHSGKSLSTNLSPLTKEALAKAIIEASTDNRLISGADYNVYWHLDRHSLVLLDRYEVSADSDLLDQALHNVIENAFKYSHPQTTVHIHCGIDGHFFYIAIQNQGIQLSDEESEHVTERGWRGNLAKAITASGSGIGLWLADNILKAHGGRLQTIATNSQRITEFRLLLPITRMPGGKPWKSS